MGVSSHGEGSPPLQGTETPMGPAQATNPSLERPNPLKPAVPTEIHRVTLRLWDVLILEGERVLTAMAHASVKTYRKRLMKLSWSTIWEFQERLSQSWALEDNAILGNLQASVKELTRTHWELPPLAKLKEGSSGVSSGFGPPCEEDRQTVPTAPAQLQELMPPLRQRPCPPPAWPDKAVPKAQIEAISTRGLPKNPEPAQRLKIRAVCPPASQWKRTARSSVPPLHADETVGDPRFLRFHFKHGARDSAGASPGPSSTPRPLEVTEDQDEGHPSPGEVRLCVSHNCSSSSSSGSSVPPRHAGSPIRDLHFLRCHFKHGARDSAGASPGPRALCHPLRDPEAQDHEGRLSPGEVRLSIPWKCPPRSSAPRLHTLPPGTQVSSARCHFDHGSWDSSVSTSSTDSPGTTRRAPPSKPTGTLTLDPAWAYEREEAFQEKPSNSVSPACDSPWQKNMARTGPGALRPAASKTQMAAGPCFLQLFYFYFMFMASGPWEIRLDGELGPSRPLEGRLSMGFPQPPPASSMPWDL
ncbi:LOW QUALITY PROTEIN: Ubiquitin carboxyl-terminal hydrolase 6 [Plecturocebus cupreus]